MGRCGGDLAPDVSVPRQSLMHKIAIVRAASTVAKVMEPDARDIMQMQESTWSGGRDHADRNDRREVAASGNR